MLDRLWFVKYQKLLLWLCNTPLIRIWFRWLLKIDSYKRIDGILPNAIFHRIDTKRVGYEIRTHDKYAKRLFYGLYPIWFVIHAWDMVIANRLKPDWNLGFDTFPGEPLFPAAGSSSPVDGRVTRGGVSENFATIRAGAGTAASDVLATGASSIGIIGSGASTYTDLFRSIYCFNTAVLGGGTVLTAVFSLWGESLGTVLGTFNAHVCSATPASTSTLAATDYANLGTTSFANIASASLTNGAYNSFTLDANGVANVNASGISKFGLRINWDINNDTTGLGTGSGASTWESSWADAAGTANDPKLTGTYTPPLVTTFGGYSFVI